MKEYRMILLATLMTFGFFTIANAQATEGKTKGKVVMTGKPGTLAAPTNGNTDENKGWNGKCPEYLDCHTGEIQYFEYKKDMVVDAPEVCGPLGVKACVILKGRCDVDRSSKNGATVTLACKPFQCPITKPYKIIGTSPKDPTCKASGNSCFQSASSLNEKDALISILVTPIIENGTCVALKLTYPTNKSGRGKDPADPGF